MNLIFISINLFNYLLPIFDPAYDLGNLDCHGGRNNVVELDPKLLLSFVIQFGGRRVRTARLDGGAPL